MTRSEIEEILIMLEREYPEPLRLSSFTLAESEKQEFMTNLLELKDRELIDARFQLSRLRNSHGMPLNVVGIIITKQGREFLEYEPEPQTVNQSINQTINVTNSDNTNLPINIAAGDININNDLDVAKLIETILINIDKSNLPTEEKRNLEKSIKSIFAGTAPAVVAGIVVESVKGIFSL